MKCTRVLLLEHVSTVADYHQIKYICVYGMKRIHIIDFLNLHLNVACLPCTLPIYCKLIAENVGRVAQSAWTVRGLNPVGARFFAQVQTGPVQWVPGLSRG
jgi:hypothetical protein